MHVYKSEIKAFESTDNGFSITFKKGIKGKRKLLEAMLKQAVETISQLA